MRRSPDAGCDLVELPCACATARRVARTLTQLYDDHLRAAGLEAAQFALLSYLDTQGPATQSVIGRRLGLDKTTLSRNLKVLRDRGWVERVDADDARHRLYRVSRSGRTRLTAAAAGWRRAQGALRTAMGERQWAEMWRAFRGVTGAASMAARASDR